MARAWVTGDLHGDLGDGRLTAERWPEGQGLARDDYLVVCGDFGLVWADPPLDQDERALDWLEAQPWTTLFVDGNHENHDLLDAMPVTAWRGGRVHVLPGHPHVVHLMRGQVYEMGELGRWFCFGGASSHDVRGRRLGLDWWDRELPSEDEMGEGLASLARVGFAVDYVLTHDCPAGLKDRAVLSSLDRPREATPADELNDCLRGVDGRLDEGRLKRWYCGQYHGDLALDAEGRHVLLYLQVVSLGGLPEER